ncbi:L,D-transpeptidase family protein [Bacillus lacus]|uniref:L,D-transpeptidase family protein n=2 Tax=Metabacillus lacus TaxID=1983721 RepID=A0A7X2LYK5_9BACI|nr:L,D-transpeptidase family protein [Metabacillus lacus]
MKAVTGPKGIGVKQREGDGVTPEGIYPIGISFGLGKKPYGVKIPYRQITANDYYVDDPASPDYNKWIAYSGDPKKKWNSFERMNIPFYKLGFEVQYNKNPIIKGKGSAIFFHVWKGPGFPTAGCIALSENDVLKLMKWLDPSNKPLIIISETAAGATIKKHGYSQISWLTAEMETTLKKARPLYSINVKRKEDLIVPAELSAEYSSLRKQFSQLELFSALKGQSSKAAYEQLYLERSRVVSYIDAVNYLHKTLKASSSDFEASLRQGVLTENMNQRYDTLSASINKAETLAGRMYGSHVRSLVYSSYVKEAKILKENVIYEISRYRLLQNMEADLKAGKSIEADMLVLQRLKKRSSSIKEAGNRLHPGKYPSYPKIEALLLEMEKNISTE